MSALHSQGIHLMCPGARHMLVSWQTGEARIGPSSAPPAPHDPQRVPAHVRYSRTDSTLQNHGEVASAASHHSVVYRYA